ncbi:MAG: MBL fold metallo-hydrolase [Pseudomonadales bacterium]|nr:MBL fold metallo-hydrolase [Pseudomonadales bacterium]MBO6563374.1 MBL fold metallo-hydrolase [Pseudomonadales bacterium]MBO6596236.1 MBL fold metallo-hydrolase [Pseudomonadales bacterium]MBO6702847.1 MBL fold metallo-hydrolase [Pseudomonadales bacterium]MBO6822716.1 MBL fold metallo-hydrolase [Pseudomonadales bacterium]
MSELLELSSAVIDGKKTEEEVGPMNRVNFRLSELTKNIAVVEAFSHCVTFKTDDGLVAFDTSGPLGGPKVVDALRQWSKDPFNSLVYTHGHVDHVGGCGAFIEDAEAKGSPKPRVIGHENVPKRFDRYDFTNGYNMVINQRQFGQFSRRGYQIQDGETFLPGSSPKPDTTYSDTMDLNVGGMDFHLIHAKGETDDHTWAWIPEHKAICAGDFFIWCFPNAGNPQKVQRYPVEWAAAMRDMASKGAELFLPAHGLPIEGEERIKGVLNSVAEALEFLVRETIERMNDGARLNEIIHEVQIDPAVLEKPYLRPIYDEPEFVVRNIWRMYGGWYDGNPAQLKPAPDSTLAAELASLSGGSEKLAERGHELIDSDIRLACHLVELAAQAEPNNAAVHELRAAVYQHRREMETSLMSKGIYGSAVNESKDKLEHTND